MTIPFVAGELIMAAFLMLSAVAKAAQPALAAKAVEQLGLRPTLARLAVRASIAAEVGVAFGIVLYPRSVITESACTCLFGLFAYIAVLALRSGRSIECGCMGGLHRSKLGWPQIAQSLVAVTLSILLHRYGVAWGLRTNLAALVALELAIVGALVVKLAHSWIRLRRDRVSLSSSRLIARRLGWSTPLSPASGLEGAS